MILFLDLFFQAEQDLEFSKKVKVKVKVNVDLYSAASWTRLWGTQVRHVFSRDLTVLPAHLAFIR